MNIKKQVIEMGMKAKKASRILADASTKVKNLALEKLTESLEENEEVILNTNKNDMEKGEKLGLSSALMDRLLLSEYRIKQMVDGLKMLIELNDPIGEVTEVKKRPNNLQIGKMRVPLGVIGIIYESRPNVTVDVSALCLKSGNAVILRGGSEAINSNRILVEIIRDAIYEAGLPRDSVQLISTTDRKAVEVLLKLNEYLDVLIPRGGSELINRVINESRVPTIETGVGNCHIYIDSPADIKMALKVTLNAKTDRPAVCNAAETLLIHKSISNEFIQHIFKLFKNEGVELRGCDKCRKIVPEIILANEDDWEREYLDYIMAVKVVSNIDEAIEHIHKYGTGHSESIITDSYTNANKFLKKVDSSAVYVNASTRFTDGCEFGMGSEIGISTQKLHARGPMGLNELTTIKFIIRGNGQIRET